MSEIRALDFVPLGLPLHKLTICATMIWRITQSASLAYHFSEGSQLVVPLLRPRHRSWYLPRWTWSLRACSRLSPIHWIYPLSFSIMFNCCWTFLRNPFVHVMSGCVSAMHCNSLSRMSEYLDGALSISRPVLSWCRNVSTLTRNSENTL